MSMAETWGMVVGWPNVDDRDVGNGCGWAKCRWQRRGEWLWVGQMSMLAVRGRAGHADRYCPLADTIACSVAPGKDSRCLNLTVV